MVETYINEKCTGMCGKHRISWCSNMYFLGCPMCFKNDYLDRGYYLDDNRIPKSEIKQEWHS